MAKAAMKARDDAIRFLGDLQRLDIRPGDRFVLKVPGMITKEQHDHIQDAWRKFVGGDADEMKLLILDGGIDIGVIGKA